MGVANIVLRAAQVVVDVAELGLMAYLAYLATRTYQDCEYDVFSETVICTNVRGRLSDLGAFMLFNAAWTLLLLAVLLLVPLCTSKLHPIAVAVLDGLTMIFWFAGAIAFAVSVGPYTSYTGNSPLLAIPRAVTGLAFLLWLLFLISLILNIRVAWSGRKSSQSTGAAQSYTGPTNFPQQGGGYNPQSPGVAAAQGTYMQPMQQQPMQQASPMQSPVQQPVQPVPNQQYPPQQYPPQQYPQQQPSPGTYNNQGAAAANADYYNQNPELAHA